MATLAIEDWVARLQDADHPDHVIRTILEECLSSNALGNFNRVANELVTTDKYANILESTPLELIPILLLANHSIADHPDDVRRTLELIGQHGSPKELLLAIQESLDGLVQAARDLENLDVADDTTQPSTPAQIVWKWIRLIDMYTLAFPRLTPRKRSAPDTAAPIIQHLRKSFDKLAPLVDPNRSEAEEIVAGCIRLGYALLGWFNAVHADEGEILGCKVALEDLLYVSVAQCLSDESVFREQNNFLSNLRTAGLDFTPERHPSSEEKLTSISKPYILGALIFYYLSQRGPVRPKGTRGALRSQLEGFSLCLPEPRWRETAIGFLNDCVFGGLYDDEPLEEDVATKVVPPVSWAASTDPNPKNRATLFNLLTRVVMKVQPEVAFKLVRDLASDYCPYQNMRGSAIGLLRRLVVRAFSQTPPPSDDPFATRLLLEEYKSILFRSPVLEEKNDGEPRSIDSQEMSRIVESLGFYYVLLGRDTNNLTGARDPDLVQEIKESFIAPLRKLLAEVEVTSEDPSLLFSLRSTEISLERVEEILTELKG